MKRRAVLALSCLVATARAQPRSIVASEAIEVIGPAVQAPRRFTTEELAQLPPEAIGSSTASRGAPGQESRTTVRGAPLAALIERAGLSAGAREDWKNLWVTVTATDGYRAHFAWTELVNTPGGANVLVVFERDGRPLDAREGRLMLEAPGDIRSGPRHVRNAMRIEVRPAP